MNTFGRVTLELLEGFGTSCYIFAATLVLSLPLGLVLCSASRSRFKPLSVLVKTVVWIVRGTPLMLQIIAIFYGPYLLFGVSGVDRVPTVILAFTINYACYFSEIFRGGVESVPKGQYEAGAVLGMKRGQIFFLVIFPQLVKRILAPMSNEVMTLVKDTSLARVISVVEIITVAQNYARGGLIWPLFYTGVFYLAFIGILTLVFRFAERKMSYIKV